MAFLAALPEVLGAVGEAGAAAGEAGAAGAAEGGAGAAEGGGPLSKLGKLFQAKPKPLASDGSKQQNVGASRTDNFIDSANTVRSALRGGVD